MKHLVVALPTALALVVTLALPAMSSVGGVDERQVDRLHEVFPDWSRAEIGEVVAAEAKESGVSVSRVVDDALAEERASRVPLSSTELRSQHTPEAYWAKNDQGQRLMTMGAASSPSFGRTVYLGNADRIGDVFFKPSTLTHTGIYHLKSYFTEAPGLGKRARSTRARTYETVQATSKMYVRTTTSRREKSGAFARTQVPKKYSANFAFNKNKNYPYTRETYNCSALVWASYRNHSIDLDGNGGTGVYPSNIKNSSMTVTYEYAY